LLKELRIKNLAIIKEINLNIKEKFIVLTGETGAGKSIILDGINLLIGEKVHTDMIRKDADVLLAEGVFNINSDSIEKLEEINIEPDDELIIKRTIETAGKNKILCNDSRITLSGLKNVMKTVVDLVGQHTHQMLLDKNQHLNLIDKYLDDEGEVLKKDIRSIHSRYIEINSKIYNIEEEIKELREKKDYYQFQLNEINKANLIENEDVILESEYKILFNAGKIKDNLTDSVLKLRNGDTNIMSMLSSVKHNIEKISNYSEEFSKVYDKIDEIYYDIEEVFYSIDNKLEDIECNDNRLSEVVEKLDIIKKLKLKYGFEIKEILEYKEILKNKIALTENNSEIDILNKEKKILEEEHKNNSIKLTEKRRKIANDIEYKIVKELSDLNMENIKFKVHFVKLAEMNPTGNENIEFLISTNIGEDMKPLSKIVSGGEISRIMLALKSVFSKVDNISLLIFDEIDTGIGGETVKKIANKLDELSKYTQIICITHSPHIASRAKQHFYIEKKIVDNETITYVNELDNEGRINEISRMLSGNTKSEIVREHAISLLRGEE